MQPRRSRRRAAPPPPLGQRHPPVTRRELLPRPLTGGSAARPSQGPRVTPPDPPLGRAKAQGAAAAFAPPGRECFLASSVLSSLSSFLEFFFLFCLCFTTRSIGSFFSGQRSF
ncbi:hypothetical protein BS78_02G046500 [Paspalum vaginatum]|nr:hypothetical protein BS78_02G046500 [Paspalum vaginatum]